MDANTASVIVAVVIAVIVIAGYLLYRGGVNTQVNLPFGITLKQRGTNKAGIKAEDLESGGEIVADNKTGGELVLKKLKAKKNIELRNSNDQGGKRPKGNPPA